MEYLGLAQQLGIEGIVRGKELRARCPLHDDSHPSFSVNITTGRWKCHARCGGGEFSHLVERIFNCSIGEAWEWIRSNGNKATLNSLMSSLEDTFLSLDAHVEQSNSDTPIWEKHFQSLNNNQMPTWFFERGFTWKTVNRWNLRYDQVWNSVVIPIYWQDKLVGTVTRNSIKEPKYENSPNLPKSSILWGEITHLQNEIIVCEGALDNLWLWQLGYRSIGLLGSDLSNEQSKLLTKLSIGEIILALDNDEAGIKGTQNALDTLVNNGWMLTQITQIKFPKGIKDPQDCTPEQFMKLYEERQPVFSLSF